MSELDRIIASGEVKSSVALAFSRMFRALTSHRRENPAEMQRARYLSFYPDEQLELKMGLYPKTAKSPQLKVDRFSLSNLSLTLDPVQRIALKLYAQRLVRPSP